MSIQIVPVIDNYITQFMGLDRSIPRIFVDTETLISEYHNKYPKVSKFKRKLLIKLIVVQSIEKNKQLKTIHFNNSS